MGTINRKCSHNTSKVIAGHGWRKMRQNTSKMKEMAGVRPEWGYSSHFLGIYLQEKIKAAVFLKKMLVKNWGQKNPMGNIDFSQSQTCITRSGKKAQ